MPRERSMSTSNACRFSDRDLSPLSAAAGDLVLAESATPRVFNGLDGSYRDFSG